MTEEQYQYELSIMDIKDLLQDLINEAQCETYNGWHRRQSSKEIKVDICQRLDNLKAK